MTSKACTICDESQYLEDFPLRASSRDGRRHQCKDCLNAAKRAHYQQRKEHFQAKSRQYARTERGKVSHKNRTLLRKYGITHSDYKDMLAQQGSRCAICSKLHEEDSMLVVDHCHSTGAVRGLLCQQCNSGIGFLRDDEDLVKRAYIYLVEHEMWTPYAIEA